MKHKKQLLILFAAISLLLAACSSASEDTSVPGIIEQVGDTEDSTGFQDEVTASSEQEAEQQADPPADPAAAPEPPAADEPVVEPAVSAGEQGESASDPTEDFNIFSAAAFDIQVAYPDGWLVTENPELGLIIESSEGFFESMATAEGAAIIIYPRDELADEEIVEALRQSVFNFGPHPSIFIEYPTVSVNGNQNMATAAFSERETGTEGYYVFIQGEGQGVFVFAASTGLAKAHFLSLMEATIDSVGLGEARS